MVNDLLPAERGKARVCYRRMTHDFALLAVDYEIAVSEPLPCEPAVMEGESGDSELFRSWPDSSRRLSPQTHA